MGKLIKFASKAEWEAAEKAEHARKMLGYGQPSGSRRTPAEYTARLRMTFHQINHEEDMRANDPEYQKDREKPEA